MRRASRFALGCLLLVLGSVLVTGVRGPADAQPTSGAQQPGAPYRDGQLLVRFRAGTTVQQREATLAAAGARDAGARGAVRLLHVGRGQVRGAVTRLAASPYVRYAEPDYVGELASLPNDPSLPSQWPLQNTGQKVNGITGAAGADENASAAWALTTGSASIVVGEVDTGVDYTHPDLAANVWRNPGGVNGCPAGTRGYNVIRGTCDPMDDDTVYGGHGSHVAGIIGAVGNNGVGVVGVNWTTTILPVKTVNSSGSGTTSDLLAGLDWLVRAKQAGVNVRVVNDSQTWKGTAYSQALRDEIDVLGQNDILFVTAGGNTSDNNDDPAVRRYPCGYVRSNELCAAASTQTDTLASFANRGSTTVDIAAPGDNVYSTLRGGGYGFVSGSSMAAAEVSGAAALVLAQRSLPTLALKAALLQGADPLGTLKGLVRVGARLDACGALSGCAPPWPIAGNVGQSTVGAQSDSLSTNRKRVNRVTLQAAATISSLSMYLAPTSTQGSASLIGVLYSDAGGPANLLGSTAPLTFTSSGTAGWYVLAFPSPLTLQPGRYWLGVLSGGTSGVVGVRWNSVTSSRAYNTNSFSSGPSSVFGGARYDSELMSVYAPYTATSPLPFAVTPPDVAVTGSSAPAPEQSQQVSATPGDWTPTPASFAYQWASCSSTGTNCVPVAGATGSTYLPTGGDVGKTLQAQVTTTSTTGTTATSVSPPTLVVAAAPGPSPSPTASPSPSPSPTASPSPSPSPTPSPTLSGGTFGVTAIGANVDSMAADRKRVNVASLPVAGAVTSLSMYLAPSGVSGSQVVEGVLYADAQGAPGALLGTTDPLTFSSTQAANWYPLSFATPVALQPGTYWIGVLSGGSPNVIGFRWTSSPGSRAYNANTFASGPSNPFGTPTVDGELMSVYATYS